MSFIEMLRLFIYAFILSCILFWFFIYFYLFIIEFIYFALIYLSKNVYVFPMLFF